MLGKKNYLKLFESREEVEEFFNFMDRDYDGNLSFEVFSSKNSANFQDYTLFEINMHILRSLWGRSLPLRSCSKTWIRWKLKRKLTKLFPNGQKLQKIYLKVKIISKWSEINQNGLKSKSHSQMVRNYRKLTLKSKLPPERRRNCVTGRIPANVQQSFVGGGDLAIHSSAVKMTLDFIWELC